ncbi:MAG: type II toxin-antitoxin system ParD family antitoxin [Thermodesulfobacteriota bacterium]
MNISLTPEMDRWVADQVKSGTYKSSSEVIRDGLRALQRQEEQRLAMLADLRQELLIGVKQLDAGKSAALDASLLQNIKKRGRGKLGT